MTDHSINSDLIVRSFQTFPQPPGADDPPGLQLSLAMFGSVWLLRKKNLTLGTFYFVLHIPSLPIKSFSSSHVFAHP